ncbi:MAG TPA: RIP metalloprotease RseP, partial [Bacteroidetes bacterium]|nr:RIP metalloprotease RseP [Bacteroidota bacterium]
MIVTLISFIIVLGVVVFVHELGHFLAAKAAGARVEVFSLGFPPKLAGIKRGET